MPCTAAAVAAAAAAALLTVWTARTSALPSLDQDFLCKYNHQESYDLKKTRVSGIDIVYTYIYVCTEVEVAKEGLGSIVWEVQGS